MKKSPKRLDRPSFWKWAIPLVLGLVVLSILPLAGAAFPVGGLNAVIIAVSAVALVRVVLLIFLAMALAWRFRDIGWPAWIGPTILLVTRLLRSLVVSYATATLNEDILEWVPTISWISDFLSLVLLIVAGFVPGKPASIELAEVFD